MHHEEVDVNKGFKGNGHVDSWLLELESFLG